MFVDRLTPVPAGYASSYTFDDLTIENKKVMLTRNMPMVLIYTQIFVELSRRRKKNVVLGVEKLFCTPSWWSFDEVEKGDLLRGTVECVKAGGIEEYFRNLYISHDSRFHRKEASVEEPAFLVGGLVTETLMLFLYGVGISVTKFFLELMVDFVMHGAFRRRVNYLRNYLFA